MSTTRKLTPDEQAEAERLMPYAARLARWLLSNPETGKLRVDRDTLDDFTSEAYLLLCQAILVCPLTDPQERRYWAGTAVRRRLINFWESQQKGSNDKKRRLGYTHFRPLTVHDVIARLPTQLQPVALARWSEQNRRTPWVTLAQEQHLTVPEARAQLSEARDLARVILNDEATSDVLPPDDEHPDTPPS